MGSGESPASTPVEVLDHGQILLAFGDDSGPSLESYSEGVALKKRRRELEQSLRFAKEQGLVERYRQASQGLDQVAGIEKEFKKLENPGPFYPVFVGEAPEEWLSPHAVAALEFRSGRTEVDSARKLRLTDRVSVGAVQGELAYWMADFRVVEEESPVGVFVAGFGFGHLAETSDVPLLPIDVHLARFAEHPDRGYGRLIKLALTNPSPDLWLLGRLGSGPIAGGGRRTPRPPSHNRLPLEGLNQKERSDHNVRHSGLKLYRRVRQAPSKRPEGVLG